MDEPLTIRDWLTQYESAIVEIATTALGFGEVALEERGFALAGSVGGAYLSLTGEAEEIQLGLATDLDGGQRLAKALLGMDPAEEDLPVNDMADAVCEVVNIVAGMMKRSISTRAPGLTLGLPIFVRGGVQATDRMLAVGSTVRFGDTLASVVVLQPEGLPADAIPPPQFAMSSP